MRHICYEYNNGIAVIKFFYLRIQLENKLMSDDEDVDEEGAAKSNVLCIVIVAVLIIAILTALVILVVYFVVLKPGSSDSKDLLSKTFKGESGRNDSDELSDLAKRLVVVTDRLLNFSEADEYCKTLKPSKRLFFPNDPVEEEALEEKLDDLIPSEILDGTISPIQKTCGNDYFIGVRKILDRDWKTQDDDFVFGPVFLAEMFLVHEDPSEQCLGLTEDKNNIFFRTIDCDESDGWNCILCETKCSNSSSGLCYDIYVDKFRTDFDSASEFCEELDIPANLASIKHKSILDDVTSQIKTRMKECSVVGIGHQFAQNYESIDEKPLTYETQQILYRPQRKAYHNCIAVTIETEFRWEPVECSEKHCFVCN